MTPDQFIVLIKAIDFVAMTWIFAILVGKFDVTPNEWIWKRVSYQKQVEQQELDDKMLTYLTDPNSTYHEVFGDQYLLSPPPNPIPEWMQRMETPNRDPELERMFGDLDKAIAQLNEPYVEGSISAEQMELAKKAVKSAADTAAKLEAGTHHYVLQDGHIVLTQKKLDEIEARGELDAS